MSPLQSRVLPRAGYPGYQNYQMPYYHGLRFPYVANVLSRYPVKDSDYDSGSDVTSTTMSRKSGRMATKKRRLMVVMITALVIIGIALTGVSIWLSGEWSSQRISR